MSTRSRPKSDSFLRAEAALRAPRSSGPRGSGRGSSGGGDSGGGGDKPPAKPSKSRSGGGGGGRKGRRGLAGRLVSWALTLMIWGAVAVGGLVAYYAWDLPDVSALTTITRRPSVTFVSVEGEVFASYGDIYGDPLMLHQLPKELPQAVMATEDRNFYSHFGMDPLGLARAMWVNVRAGRIVQGGSTITQQLAKNLFLSPERSLKRKVQEVLMAFWLEKEFSKDQILTLYLNRVYLGAGTYGVDAAARRYFGISARDLSLYQSAMLAGLLKAPSRYNPVADLDAAKGRTKVVLGAMQAAGYVSAAQAAAAERSGPGSIRKTSPGGRYFADWLKPQVDQYVGSADRDLVIRTTLDLKTQRKAEQEIEAVLAAQGAKKGAAQAAMVVMTPEGAVRAMVGGRDYGESQFNRATQGLRQPGSAFKPFVYLAALEAGRSSQDLVEDAPIKIGKWRPANYDGKYRGPVSLEYALAHSLNTVSVRLIEEVGPERVAEAAHRLGISAQLRADGSLALGTSEVNLLELTGAYAAFASGGSAAWVHGISEIRDAATGELVYQRGGSGPGVQVSGRDVAQMNQMLSAVVDMGTGKAARIGRPVAGKTGTAQDYRDAWFVGYSADLVAGVWVGNDDRSPMKKVTGSTLPAQIFAKVMTAAHQGLPPRDLPGMGWQPPLAADDGSSPIEDLGIPEASKEVKDFLGGLFDRLLGG